MNIKELEYILLRSASLFMKKEGEKAFKEGLVTITSGKKIDNIYHVYGSIKGIGRTEEVKTHIKINLLKKKLEGIRCTCDDFSELSRNGNTFICSHLTATAYKFLNQISKNRNNGNEGIENNTEDNSDKREAGISARLVRKVSENNIYYEGQKALGSEKLKIEQNDLRAFLETIENRKIRFKYEHLESAMPILQKNLPLTFTLKELNEKILLTTHKQLPISLNSNNDVYLYKNEIYLPKKEQIDRYLPLYEKFKEQGRILYKKDINNYYKIISLLSSITHNINISEELRSFISSLIKPSFFIYERQKKIYCDLFMIYGNERINILKEDISKESVLRDHNKEEKLLMAIEKYKFIRRKDKLMFVGGDEELFNILSKRNHSIHSLGNVTFGSGIKDRKVYNSSSIEAVLLQNEEYLDFSYGIRDVEARELVDIFNAYKDNKRFYKTRDNGFIDFEEDGIRDFFNLLYVLNEDKKMDGLIKLEKNKAIYLIENINNRGIKFIKGTDTIKNIESKLSNIKNTNITPPKNLNGTLREYQISGFRWFKGLSELGFGGILADEMGLGKTIQTITFVLSEEDKKVIIVCPTSLIYNWKNEFEKFAPSLKVAIVHGEKSERIKFINSIFEYNVILTTYGTLKMDIELYRNIVFDYCIIDEAQNIKNSFSQNTRSIKELKAEARFALTGTPIENNLIELWSIFDFIMPGYLYSKESFEEKFTRGTEDLEELKLLIKPFVLRRTKKEVMKELPDKIEKKFLVEMTAAQKAVYSTYAKYVRDSIKSNQHGKIEVFSYLMKLRQICLDPSLIIDEYEGGSGKLRIALEFIQKHIEDCGKVLLFSQFTSVLNKVGDNLKDKGIEFFHLDGSTRPRERIRMVNEFNSGEDIKVFLISLKAGGTGLNLTSANLVIHFDPWWNPAVEDQATDRAHRIGQKNIVEVIKLIAKGTIEEKIILLQEDKKELIENIITGELSSSNSLYKLSKEELLQLFDR